MTFAAFPLRTGIAGLGLLLAACAGPAPQSRPAAPPSAQRPSPVVPAMPGQASPAAPAGAPPAIEQPPERPSLGLFSHIKAPSELEPSFALKATGVQIFRCEPDKDGYHWAFRLPEAELRDARGQVVAHHGAEYSFEHLDGSRLLGSIVNHDSASNDDSIAWLLLQTRSYGQGEFDHIGYVQRINTQGGMPPKQCSAEQGNQVLRVPFSADFIFYRGH